MRESKAHSLEELVADRPPLDVAADLTVAVDGHELRVESYTNRLFIDIPSPRAALAAIRGLPSNRHSVGAAGRTLKGADLTMVVRLAGSEVARLGADLEGIEFGALSVRPAGLIRALLG